MKVTYKFLDGKVSEIEVDDELGQVIAEMDKDEFNLNRRETRRHVQLSALDPNGRYLPTENDILQDLIEKEFRSEFHNVFSKLEPKQRELLYRKYVLRETQAKIAASEGVSQQTISVRLNKLHRKIKKILK